MNLNESLQLGILCYCADQGMTQEETHALVKKAADKEAWTRLLTAPFDYATRLLSAFGPSALGLAAAAAVGVPIATGVGGGYLLAKATEPEIDPEEAKGDEVIEQYKRLTDQARRRELLKGIHGVPTVGQKAAAIEKLAGLLSGLGNVARSLRRPLVGIPAAAGATAIGGSYLLHDMHQNAIRSDPFFQRARQDHAQLIGPPDPTVQHSIQPGGEANITPPRTTTNTIPGLGTFTTNVPAMATYNSPPSTLGMVNNFADNWLPPWLYRPLLPDTSARGRAWSFPVTPERTP